MSNTAFTQGTLSLKIRKDFKDLSHRAKQNKLIYVHILGLSLPLNPRICRNPEFMVFSFLPTEPSIKMRCSTETYIIQEPQRQRIQSFLNFNVVDNKHGSKRAF